MENDTAGPSVLRKVLHLDFLVHETEFPWFPQLSLYQDGNTEVYTGLPDDEG